MRYKKYIQCVIPLCLLLSFPVIVKAAQIIIQDKANNFILEEISKGLGVTWGMAFISKDEIIFTQRKGKIGLLNVKTAKLSWLKNPLSIYHNGQAGLLDLAVPADFCHSSWIYFSYSKKLLDKSTTALARAKLNNGELSHWQDILVTQAAENTNYHYGSRITFDNKGHVFFSIGDRGKRPNAQNLLNHAGSILRLNLDGSIPKDNPYVNDSNSLAEIWSYGHRNPQGLFYDQKKGYFMVNRTWAQRWR